MEKIHLVTVQTAPPRGDFPGSVEEGFYRVEGGTTVVLVDAKGKQRFTKAGKSIKQLLARGQTARAVAWQLTKAHAPNRRPRFNGPLTYFDFGKI